jgi:hypothetical protein
LSERLVKSLTVFFSLVSVSALLPFLLRTSPSPVSRVLLLSRCLDCGAENTFDQGTTDSTASNSITPQSFTLRKHRHYLQRGSAALHIARHCVSSAQLISAKRHMVLYVPNPGERHHRADYIFPRVRSRRCDRRHPLLIAYRYGGCAYRVSS